jgi:hypothetical protein
LLPSKKDGVLDRTVGNVRIIAAVVTRHNEFFSFRAETFADRRGTGYFDGNYGSFCRNHQSFTRYNITQKEADDICWDAFGLCPCDCIWTAPG